MKLNSMLAGVLGGLVLLCGGCRYATPGDPGDTGARSNRTTISRMAVDQGGCDPSPRKTQTISLQGTTQYEASGTKSPAYTIVFEQPNLSMNARPEADWNLTEGAAYMSVATASATPSSGTVWGWKWRIIVTRAFVIGVESRHAVVRVFVDPISKLEHVQIQASGSGNVPSGVGGVEIALLANYKSTFATIGKDQYLELVEGMSAPPAATSPPTSGDFFDLVNRLERKAACTGFTDPRFTGPTRSDDGGN